MLGNISKNIEYQSDLERDSRGYSICTRNIRHHRDRKLLELAQLLLSDMVFSADSYEWVLYTFTASIPTFPSRYACATCAHIPLHARVSHANIGRFSHTFCERAGVLVSPSR